LNSFLIFLRSEILIYLKLSEIAELSYGPNATPLTIHFLPKTLNLIKNSRKIVKNWLKNILKIFDKI